VQTISGFPVRIGDMRPRNTSESQFKSPPQRTPGAVARGTLYDGCAPTFQLWDFVVGDDYHRCESDLGLHFSSGRS